MGWEWLNVDPPDAYLLFINVRSSFFTRKCRWEKPESAFNRNRQDVSSLTSGYPPICARPPA